MKTRDPAGRAATRIEHPTSAGCRPVDSVPVAGSTISSETPAWARELAARLNAERGGAKTTEDIDALVDDARTALAGASVLDFVPLFVERRVRASL